MSKRKRIAISGMGRIGRSILKINLLNNDFDVAFCNDINPDIKNLVYLLNYDRLTEVQKIDLVLSNRKFHAITIISIIFIKIHSWKSSGISMMSIFLYYHQD